MRPTTFGSVNWRPPPSGLLGILGPRNAVTNPSLSQTARTPSHFSSTPQIRGMNVLVYAGAGVARGSIEHTILTLRSQLSSHYDVIPIDTNTLLTEPWQATTALLVMPGGRDLPYVKDLSAPSQGTRLIREYIKRGGKYLGICAGAYFACERVEFEVGRTGYEVVGPRDLALVPAVARGSVVPGFVYGSEAGARALPIKLNGQVLGWPEESFVIKNIYVNGGPFFDLKDTSPDPANGRSATTTLAWYNGEEPSQIGAADSQPAIVEVQLGAGSAILSGPHIECNAELMGNPSPDMSLDEQAAARKLAEELKDSEKGRQQLVRMVLSRLGLKLNDPQDVERIVHEIIYPSEKITPMVLCGIDDGTSGGEKGEVHDMLQRFSEVAQQVSIPAPSQQEGTPESSFAAVRSMRRLMVLKDHLDTICIAERIVDKGGLKSLLIDAMLDTELREQLDQLRVSEEEEKEQQQKKKGTTPSSTSSGGDVLETIKRTQHQQPVIIHRFSDGEGPTKVDTPYFDVKNYLALLRQLRAEYDCEERASWSCGSPVLYGEIVSSTQTVLEKFVKWVKTLSFFDAGQYYDLYGITLTRTSPFYRNTKFLSCIPSGLVCVASHQLAGRGRGRNSWISGKGSLLYSFTLRHTDASSIVFIQYLVGLAFVEAVRSRKGYENLPIHLKWPNDIYVKLEKKDGSEPELRKIGGILVNSSYFRGVFTLII
ncbi:biotin holocarboxylase synthetase, partial [Quaeritorhiza haematococci]